MSDVVWHVLSVLLSLSICPVNTSHVIESGREQQQPNGLVSISNQASGLQVCMVSVLLVEVVGELCVGALAFAPHVADPRLSEMRCGWKPFMTSYCGRVGKVIEADEHCVKLYSCGKEIWWDIPLFDSCLRRFCHKGCSLEHELVESPTCICDVCLARVPIGAPKMYCDQHDYVICEYCSGQPSLPAAGARVIRGPTWSAELPVQGYEDYYEEGVVETGLLDDISLAREADNIDMPLRGYHSYFEAFRGDPKIRIASSPYTFQNTSKPRIPQKHRTKIRQHPIPTQPRKKG